MKSNFRLAIAAVFFCLCLAISFFSMSGTAEASHCFLCATDHCLIRNFGMKECTSVPLESCELSGGFCSG